jgi:hypothetical protein
MVVSRWEGELNADQLHAVMAHPVEAHPVEIGEEMERQSS